MKVVIMGCGRVGARIASILDHNGHDVSVIDTDSRAFRRLAPDFGGQTIIGTGIDEDVLRSAGIEEATAFIAVTNGDNRNIMAAQVARHVFKVPEVICRIYDPVRE
ncbi:MAG: TrkA family potassium uptake protein, partial [Chloroflexota bacterium]